MAASDSVHDRGDPYYRDFASAYDEYTRGVDGDVAFYTELARRAGSVTELGVGTGRIAIPIAQSGIPVTGIDREASMLAIAREKAEAAGVASLLTRREGDMRTFVLDEPVPLVTIPFRTFLHNLTTEDQMATLVACHQAQSPFCTAMNAHLHASIPNFMIQENFDDSQEPWTWDLLQGVPRVVDGYLQVSDAPGWGVELNEAEAARHPYGERNFLRLFEEGWETRRPPEHG